jgi:hypothetical protein
MDMVDVDPAPAIFCKSYFVAHLEVRAENFVEHLQVPDRTPAFCSQSAIS